jgi:hypothetical protein
MELMNQLYLRLKVLTKNNGNIKGTMIVVVCVNILIEFLGILVLEFRGISFHFCC